MGDAEDCGAAGAVWEADVADGFAERVFQSGVAGLEFFTHSVGWEQSEPWMHCGVVADEMASGLDGADDLSALADEAADHEEGCACVVLC